MKEKISDFAIEVHHDQMVIILPFDINETKQAFYENKVEDLNGELDIARVVRYAIAKRLENQFKEIPNYNDKEISK